MIHKLIYTAFACMLFNACTDEEIYTPSNVKEGIPVEIKFGLSIPGMDKITTRSLSEADESRVNDLYVLVFDESGQTVKSRQFYTTDDIVSAFENYRSGSLTLKTTSGISRIYAIANVQASELSGMRTQLENVENVSELLDVTAKLEEPSLERISTMTMSGTFEQNGADSELIKQGHCIISPDGGLLNGKIRLSRLDSHITFKIATGAKVRKFTPESWQVKYVPLKSTVIAQERNILSIGDNIGNDYAHSIISTGFGTSNENRNTFRTFDFYMMESIKKAIKAEDDTFIIEDVSALSDDEKKAEYAKREKEIKIIHKDEEGNISHENTGVYKYSERYATFVELKASMEIEHANSENGIRVANVTYRIHLGGGISQPANFKSKRNTKYTYLMKIEDVEDIVVEVEEDDERRPGAEGEVIDSETKVRSLDAHYNCFILGLSYNNVAISKNGVDQQNLKFVVRTPFGEVTEASTPDSDNGAKQDYHWINFKSHGDDNSPTTLQLHNGELIDLFGLSQNVIDRYHADNSPDKDKNKMYYYTVFVDEYYYNEAPKGVNWGNDPTTYWRHFANAGNRSAILVYSPKYSLDGNSSHAAARYMITQRSIQTYYSTESAIALGMEHVNENGYGYWGTPGIITDPANGLWNTWNYLKNNSNWNTHVTSTSWDEDMNTFKTNNDAIVLSRCLSRNRDENGDGQITLDEVKWYVPTSEQLMGMYLGAKSLPSPLHDADNVSFVYSQRGDHHYGTSDNKRIWAEEGASVGNFGDGWGAGGQPRNFRCVRNLGIDKTKNATLQQNEYPKEAFEYKPKQTKVRVYNQNVGVDQETWADRIFSMTRLTEQNLRGRIRSGEIGIHNNFEDGNKPYKAFQMAKDFVIPPSDRKGGANVINRDDNSDFMLTTWDAIIRSFWYETISYTNYLTTDGDRSFCKNYSEMADGSDKGLWRAPNQRELMMMYIQDKSFAYGRYGSFSRTEWKYEGSKRKFAAYANLYLSNPDDETKAFCIRCVRDVDIVTP